ncbi:B-cell antigen receptor complex-associated protein alpha chain [Myxocyprinus asiaticus]|uniref:B cell receptor complex protein CD79a n=1 Tax=Myxocyprinus asiaticus TaxID=70543 RepID=A0A384TTN2_MYXAS|nr:B-cell antigen receptor complex-associated protein alpha chain [Myxocyprinus asiaticus]AQX78128.1 B cell receptor complex protein CD79a [Myxocyprinus asiaticus]
MEFGLIFFLYFWAAVANGKHAELKLEADQPFQRVPLTDDATIQCCYRCKEKLQARWIMKLYTNNGTTVSRFVNLTEEDKPRSGANGVICHSLVLKNVHINDTGLYMCYLNYSFLGIDIFTHGTFLQVYKPLYKTLNLSENAKNSIITAEGVLLLLCVLIPGTMLLCKSKRLNELEGKKRREEENIYEGLNLDDCNSTYHQIQRSQIQGPYQDVASCGDDIQLEKP